MTIKITLDGIDYIGRKDGDRIILEPAPKIAVPRLANAPVGTPVEVSDDDAVWVRRCFEAYEQTYPLPWDCCGDWYYARLLLNYRYTWDPNWKLFMEDNMDVRAWFFDENGNINITENKVQNYNWHSRSYIITQFEVLSYES